MLHPLVAVAMLIAIGLILALPRKKAIVPFFWPFSRSRSDKCWCWEACTLRCFRS